MLQMGSSKVVYWSPRSSPPSYQQCSTRLSETWGWRLHTVQALTYSTSHTSLHYSDTDERELLFADDIALVAHSAEEMQKIVGAFSNASKKFGLKIIIKKTEVLYQREVDIMVNGNKLSSVLELTYIEAPYQIMDALTMKYRRGCVLLCSGIPK